MPAGASMASHMIDSHKNDANVTLPTAAFLCGHFKSSCPSSNSFQFLV